MSNPASNALSVPAAPAVHRFHQHGEIELRSNEGMILRAEPWKLANASKVFADMLEIPSSEPSRPSVPAKRKLEDRSKPIELDYSSDVISHFLDLAGQANVAPLPSTYGNSKILYEFCDQFDVRAGIKEVIKDRLGEVQIETDHNGETTSTRQWDLLQFAGDNNDIELGRKALAKMTAEVFSWDKDPVGRVLEDDDGRNFRGKIRSLPDSWQAEILWRAFSMPTRQGYHLPFTSQVTDDWERLAEDFDPEHDCPF